MIGTEGWEVRTVGSLGIVRGGKRLPKGRSLTVSPTPHPYVRVTDMRQGGLDTSDLRFVPDDVAPSIRAYRIFKDDIFISVAGTLGIVGRIPAELDGANLTENADRITSIACDADYLMYSLLSEPIQNEIDSIRTVGAQPKLALGRIKQFEIPIPTSRAEQERVAQALRDADDLIATLERLIAKKQAIKQGMMQQLLTGRTRLPGFSGEWRRARLGDLLSYEQPGRYLVSNTDYTDIGTPVLTAGKTFVLGHTSERFGIFANVPVVIFDDFTTASKFVDFPFKVKSTAMKMLSARPGVNLRYVFERLQLVDFVPVDHKRRWIAEFSKIEIAIPDEDEQDAIAGALTVAEAEIEILAQRLEKAHAVKAGMMQQLLTGRTRLPVEAAS